MISSELPHWVRTVPGLYCTVRSTCPDPHAEGQERKAEGGRAWRWRRAGDVPMAFHYELLSFATPSAGVAGSAATITAPGRPLQHLTASYLLELAETPTSRRDILRQKQKQNKIKQAFLLFLPRHGPRPPSRFSPRRDRGLTNWQLLSQKRAVSANAVRLLMPNQHRDRQGFSDRRTERGTQGQHGRDDDRVAQFR